MEEDWVLILSEKDISLFQNETSYKMTFDVKKSENTYSSILEIIKNNDFFELLYELNRDFIEKFTSVITDEGAQCVDIKIKNKKRDFYNFEHFTIHINCCSEIKEKEKKIVIYSLPFDNNNVLENEIYLSNFIIEISEQKDNVSFLITYNFDDEIFDTDVLKMCLSMYILKIYYRLKLYLE